MNIISKLSIQSMKRNKTTTFVTIIGIIMSLALMTGLFLFANGLVEFFRDDVALKQGDIHVTRQVMTPEDVEQLEHRELLEKETYLPYLGVYPTHDEYYQYTALLGIQPADMEKSVPLKPITGRLPEAEGEAVISGSVNVYRDEPIQVGDKVSFDVYTPEHYHVHEAGDFEKRSGEISLTIVGEVENAMPYPMNGPTVFIYQTPEQVAQADQLWGGFRLKSVSDATIKQFTEGWYDVAGWGTTNLTTYYQGVSTGVNFFVKSIAMVLLVIVAFAGIGLIQNGFLISLSQRMQELSILSSVGMTRRQKWRMAITEGGLMYLIGLPIGILSGFLAMWIVFQVLTPLMQRLFHSTAIMRLSFDVSTLVQIALAGLITVMIATIIPALRTSHTTPLAGVRQQEEITLTPRQLRSPGLIRKLFGMEGDLAWKNLQRNKRKYRGTLVSLIFSLVLYLSLASLMHYTDIANQAAMSQGREDAIVFFHGDNYDNNVREQAALALDMEGVEEGYGVFTLHAEVVDELEVVAETKVLIGSNTVPAEIISFDDATLDTLLKEWNLSREDLSGKAVLVNGYRYRSDDRSFQRGQLYSRAPQELTLKFWSEKETERPQETLDIIRVLDEPLEMYDSWYPRASLIVPSETFDRLGTSHPESVNVQLRLITDRAAHKDTIESLFESYGQANEENAVSWSIVDQRSNNQSMMDLTMIAKILFFGFASVIALISLANIYNSLMSSLQFRRREFAMLRSVGMEEKSFQRMIRFESYFYALKLLIWAIPIGFVVSYLMHWYLKRMNDMEFGIPIMHFVIASLIVVSVLILIMNLGSRTTRKGNILETLKLEID